MEKRLTVVYDDDCPTCTVGKNISEKLDKKQAIDFVGMNTERGRTLAHEHNLDVRASAYAIKDGVVAGKSQMVRTVLAHNGILGFLVSLPFRIPWLGDRLYELIVRHRSHGFREQTK